MRIDRLKLNIAADRFDLSLHPQLTFLTGISPSHRPEVGEEILDALQEGRPGLSLDITGRDGRLIEVYRPTEGATTVRDALSGADLTDRFLVGEKVNLLASRYPNLGAAGRSGFEALFVHRGSNSTLDLHNEGMPLGESSSLESHSESDGQPVEADQVHTRDASFLSNDPSVREPTVADQTEPHRSGSSPSNATDGPTNDIIQRLAQLDQDALWATALVLAETEVEVESLADTTAGREREAALRTTVETCHKAVESAAVRLEADRSLLLIVSATLALLATIGAVALHPLVAFPFLIAAVGTGSVSGWRWRQLGRASRAESEALAAAGIRSYVGLQDQTDASKTDEVAFDLANKQLAEIHRSATQAWLNLVGPDVSLDLAVASRPQIDRACARTRRQIVRPRMDLDATGSDTGAGPTPNLVAHPPTRDQNARDHLVWLHQRLATIEQTFPEPVPVIIDHPLISAVPQADMSAQGEKAGLTDSAPPTASMTCSEDPNESTAEDLGLVVDLLSLHSSQLQLIVMTDNQAVLERFAASPDRAKIVHIASQGKFDAAGNPFDSVPVTPTPSRSTHGAKQALRSTMTTQS